MTPEAPASCLLYTRGISDASCEATSNQRFTASSRLKSIVQDSSVPIVRIVSVWEDAYEETTTRGLARYPGGQFRPGRSRARRSCGARCWIHRAPCCRASPSRSRTRRPACTAKPSAARTAPSSPAAWCPASYEIAAELQGYKKFSRRDLQLEVGKTSTIEVKLEVGSLEETVNVSARVAARRRHLEGNRRQHHERDARPAAERQRQLHRLRRPAARHRAVHQHRVVRQRFDQRSTARIRATTTTCWTAATTTTT